MNNPNTPTNDFTPSTLGTKHDQGKPQFRLIPAKAEHEFVKVLTYGANKYAPDNWKHVESARYLDALGRHLNAYRQGEINDTESGLHHLAHAMCCLSFLIEKDMEKEAVQAKVIQDAGQVKESETSAADRWIPVIGETYYYLSNTGVVDSRQWQGTPQEQKRLDAGHVFKTLKGAQESDHTQSYILHENDPVKYPELKEEVWLIIETPNFAGKVSWQVTPFSYTVAKGITQPVTGGIGLTLKTALKYHNEGRIFHSKEQAEAKAKWWNMNGIKNSDRVEV